MAYQRATWHSGLKYSQTCSKCRTQVTYTDEILEFRPWYADGFIYCPTCRVPLRHRESYAVDRPEEAPHVDLTKPVPPSSPDGTAAFCSNCGRAFGEEEKFCSNCGAKR